MFIQTALPGKRGYQVNIFLIFLHKNMYKGILISTHNIFFFHAEIREIFQGK